MKRRNFLQSIGALLPLGLLKFDSKKFEEKKDIVKQPDTPVTDEFGISNSYTSSYNTNNYSYNFKSCELNEGLGWEPDLDHELMKKRSKYPHFWNGLVTIYNKNGDYIIAVSNTI